MGKLALAVPVAKSKSHDARRLGMQVICFHSPMRVFVIRPVIAVSTQRNASAHALLGAHPSVQ